MMITLTRVSTVTRNSGHYMTRRTQQTSTTYHLGLSSSRTGHTSFTYTNLFGSLGEFGLQNDLFSRSHISQLSGLKGLVWL
ncbi:Hypothetical predicted protein [Prunus dulcis]|uniref:Uncharacterized protein n=1 Tax=Prunus dulcis TaxID=3755 RepID=A0A5E4F7P5_PRUDU|nr:hypothetical protein L3X38_037755 [Prunus dulcis]VVA23947.1 Hypothetical predicted protein [Prunus dulcis]